MSLLKQGKKPHKCKTEKDMQVFGRDIHFILDSLQYQSHRVEKIQHVVGNVTVALRRWSKIEKEISESSV